MRRRLSKPPLISLESSLSSRLNYLLFLPLKCLLPVCVFYPVDAILLIPHFWLWFWFMILKFPLWSSQHLTIIYFIYTWHCNSSIPEMSSLYTHEYHCVACISISVGQQCHPYIGLNNFFALNFSKRQTYFSLNSRYVKDCVWLSPHSLVAWPLVINLGQKLNVMVMQCNHLLYVLFLGAPVEFFFFQ